MSQLLEHVREGAWDVVRRNFERLLSLLIDTGGQAVGIRFGTKTVTWSGTPTSADAVVSHGLGKAPVVAFVTGTSDAEWAVFIVHSLGASTFSIRARTADGTNATASRTVYWLAVG